MEIRYGFRSFVTVLFLSQTVVTDRRKVVLFGPWKVELLYFQDFHPINPSFLKMTN